jgi:hypothetical protein
MAENLTKRIRLLLLVMAAGLVASGATAIPLEAELRWLTQVFGGDAKAGQGGFVGWLAKVRDGLAATNSQYPFMAYGTDWLAFAHFVIAIALIGPWRDPVRNIWVVEFSMVACVLLVPFALVMGSVRGIPLGWRLIDCSFGVVGIIPLWLCRKLILQLEALGQPVPSR